MTSPAPRPAAPPPQKLGPLRIASLILLGAIVLVVIFRSVDFFRDTLFPWYEDMAARVLNVGPTAPPDDLMQAEQRIANWQSVRKHTEFIDAEHLSGRGAGLYTYLLMPSQEASERMNLFMQQMFAESLAAERAHPSPQFTNLIFVPTEDQRAITSDFWAHSSSGDSFEVAAAHLVDLHYDRKLALDLLNRFCHGDSPVCGAQGTGPFLIATATPLADKATAVPAHVFINFSAVHERAFAPLVRSLLTQINPEDANESAKLEAMRQRMTQVTIAPGDWIGSAPAGIAQLVGATPSR
jgi:hypothetical protein